MFLRRAQMPVLLTIFLLLESIRLSQPRPVLSTLGLSLASPTSPESPGVFVAVSPASACVVAGSSLLESNRLTGLVSLVVMASAPLIPVSDFSAVVGVSVLRS